jgi:hypothetical protein
MTGTYYTPRIISNYICSQLLHNEQPINTDKSKGTFNPLSGNFKMGDYKELKILDPSCGSGIFLVEIFKVMLEERMIYPKKLKPGILNFEISDVLSILHHIYGVDTDPVAISISKLSLVLEVLSVLMKMKKENNFWKILDSIFDILDSNIIRGDFLIDQIDRISDIDIIMGNPPYISSKVMDEGYKSLLRSRYVTAVKQFDIYTIFLERSYQILKPLGLFGFIIPDSFLGRSHFEGIRRLLLKNTKIWRIDQISGVFNAPNVSNIILLYEKRTDGNEILFSRYQDLKSFSNKKGESISLPQDFCLRTDKSKILYIDEPKRKILAKIKEKSHILGDFISIHRGEEIGKKSRKILTSDLNGSFKLLFGEDVKKYHIEFSNRYILRKDIQKSITLYSSPKIVIRQLGKKINAAFDNKVNFVTLQTVYNLILNNNSIKYEFLLGYLNSQLMNFYYGLMIQDKLLFPRILLENIKKIPLPIPEEKIQKEISYIVNKIVENKKTMKNTKELEEKIDAIILNLFDFKNEEKKLISEFIK